MIGTDQAQAMVTVEVPDNPGRHHAYPNLTRNAAPQSSQVVGHLLQPTVFYDGALLMGSYFTARWIVAKLRKARRLWAHGLTIS